MPMKAMAAVMAFVAGESMHVQRMCEEVGTSRQTFYKYVARCRAGGLAGFEPLSRRPHSCPQATAGDVEDAVVGWRKQLADAGLDHGATTIQWHLGRDVEFTRRCRRWRRCIGSWCAAGFVSPQPEKRPKSSRRRFEAPAPNEWWQIDSTDFVIAAAPDLVKIFNIVDDHPGWPAGHEP